MGSIVVAHGLCCSMARRIFPDQGSNLCPLHWQVGFLTTGLQESPHLFVCVQSGHPTEVTLLAGGKARFESGGMTLGPTHFTTVAGAVGLREYQRVWGGSEQARRIRSSRSGKQQWTFPPTRSSCRCHCPHLLVAQD